MIVKTIVNLSLFVGILLMAGCASTGSVHTELDPSQDFGAYTSFAWASDTPLRVIGVAEVSDASKKTVIDGVKAGLERKGYTFVEKMGEADFTVSANVGARIRSQAQEAFTLWGERRLDVDDAVEGSLAIDLFDGKSGHMVFHSIGTADIPMESIGTDSANVDQAVDEILAQLPNK